MKVTIVNGSPDDKWSKFENALDRTAKKLSKEHDISVFNVKDMDISFCCGCYSCWTKTPGRCIFKDDMEKIIRSAVKSDLLLYTSPVITGFISADTKKIMDRILPCALPFIRNFNGECHHPSRYENEPDLGVILYDDGKIDETSKGLVFDTIDRLSLNFHADRTIKVTATEENLSEVLENEIRNY